jgi:hypothetical protein
MPNKGRAMIHFARSFGIVAFVLLPALAFAQAPPTTKAPTAPSAPDARVDPSACAQPDTQTTVGKGGALETRKQDPTGNLSDKLARSNGVICPPEHVDPAMKQPTPPGGAMPVIPPPGSPGGDPSVQPK